MPAEHRQSFATRPRCPGPWTVSKELLLAIFHAVCIPMGVEEIDSVEDT